MCARVADLPATSSRPMFHLTDLILISFCDMFSDFAFILMFVCFFRVFRRDSHDFVVFSCFLFEVMMLDGQHVAPHLRAIEVTVLKCELL